MAGSKTAGPIGRDPFPSDDPRATGLGGFSSPTPIGVEPSEAIGLASGKIVKKVTKDWSDPPVVTPTFTPEISGKTLKEVLVELQKLTEWGTGGGNLKGMGVDGEITAETEDGKNYTIALKGEFFMTLPKWTGYDAATPAQKAAWDEMFANLKKHEEEHVAIAYRGAEKLRKDLKGLDVMLAAQKVADSQVAGQNAQDDFDSAAKTDHGKNDFGNFKKVNLDTTADPPPAPTP